MTGEHSKAGRRRGEGEGAAPSTPAGETAPRRLLILTTSWPLAPDDPAGVFVAEQADALRARGHEVLVLHPEGPRGSAPREGSRAVPWLRPRSLQRLVGGPGAPELLEGSPWAWAMAPPLTAALAVAAARAGRHDAVISHWLLPCGVIGAGLARALRVPHVAFCHSGDLALLERLPFRGTIARWIAGPGTTLAFVASHLRERFLRLAPVSRHVVLPMGVDGEPASPRAPGAPTRALVLGRLVPVKGVDVAVRALASRPGLTLTIAGDGPERARLEALAAAVAPGRVRFVGRLAPAAARRLIADHDVLLAPSRVLKSGRTEGMPRVILEALAAGRPVVTSAVGGALELAGTPGLTLVPADDPAAISAALTARLDPGALPDHLRWTHHVDALESLLGGVNDRKDPARNERC